MSIPLTVTFDDGSYAKVVVTPSTTAKEVCGQVMKRRGRMNLTEQNAVLCVSNSQRKSAKPVPLDPSYAVLELYQSARLGGQIVEFSIHPREMFTQDDWDPQTRRERYNSLSSFAANGNRKASIDVFVSPEMIDEYTKKWSGEAEMFGYLQKMGEVNTAYKLRFFVLKGHHLFYFKHHNDKTHVKKIDVHHCSVKEKNPKNFEFNLTNDKRIFKLKAPTKEEMLSWIVKLHKQSQVSIVDNRLIDEIQELTDTIEQTKAETREKTMKVYHDLKATLQSETAREYFLEFLIKRRSEENLLFWRAVKQYKEKKMNESERMLEAANIFNQFLRQGSPHEISVQGQLRNYVQEHMKQADAKRALFDEVNLVVTSMMENTTWPEFLASGEFQLMLIEHPLKIMSFPDMSDIQTGDVELRTILLNCVDEEGPPAMSAKKLFATMDFSHDELGQLEEKFEMGSENLMSAPSSSGYLDQGSPSNSQSKKAGATHTHLQDVVFEE